MFCDESLGRLHLAHNRLTALPAEVALCQGMDVLDAGYNQLTTLPAEVGHLAKLRVNDFRHNRITHLPDQICKLKKLDLSGNPIPEEEKERLWRVWQQEKQQSQGLKF